MDTGGHWDAVHISGGLKAREVGDGTTPGLALNDLSRH